ncbi:cell wall hydrolase [Lichenihabitans sp. Uapishka_5]|uniref:cell wall hydrolase n=1 Tax=Lichenihabitans sp. Uapishka_5 TaxID=3037302 RepID=UPI0029E81766|nr:cell wall hydrolase [Lichenihabitans sp. Uapishka_5]MDX7953055.1 cell wall hydrolase [Lichenihabitans sp. Uapishka_5]
MAATATASLAGCAGGTLSDRDCMTRVMYFESNRSSPDGMLAVGTTVMNRVAAPGYPKSVCGVVGQSGQFASGVLSRPMSPRLAAKVAEVADAVLSGERHRAVGDAMFFHTLGYSFPYTNMRYVAVAGGNAFYEKVAPGQGTAAPMPGVPFDPDAQARPRSIADILSFADDPAPVAAAITGQRIPFPGF